LLQGNELSARLKRVQATNRIKRAPRRGKVRNRLLHLKEKKEEEGVPPNEGVGASEPEKILKRACWGGGPIRKLLSSTNNEGEFTGKKSIKTKGRG